MTPEVVFLWSIIICSSDGQVVDTTPPVVTSIALGLQSSPLKTGVFEITLNIDEANGILAAPSCWYILPDTTQTDITLSQEGDEWKGTSFIESYFQNGTTEFFASVTDKAGNIGTQIVSGKTFDIDTSITPTQQVVVANSDGTKLLIFSRTFSAAAIVTAKNDVSSLNGATAEADAKNKTYLTRLFACDRFFEAKRKSDNSILNTFDKPITITIPYPDTNQDGIVDGTDAKEENLKIFYLNEVNKCWEFLTNSICNTTANTVSAEVLHFSVYTIMYINSPANLERIIVYPNPFYPGKNNYVYLGRLPASANNIEAKIYNIAGEKVAGVGGENIELYNGLKRLKWDGKSDYGNNAASGVYIYVLKAGGMDTKVGKIVVVR